MKSYFDDQLHIGHRRLPIQGTDEQFDHPLRRGNIEAAFVGEIFNFRSKGEKYQSDIFKMINDWQTLGVNAIGEWEGFWSGIVIDHEAKTAFIFNDPLGKKPLYYRQSSVDQSIAICSEIDPLVSLGEVSLNHCYMGAVWKWGYDPSPTTPYNEINMIPPGSMFVVHFTGGKDQRPRIEHVKYGADPLTSDAFKPTRSNLLFDLREAVQQRMIADVPVGILLSGGLDSTLIFELMKERTHHFTVFHVANGEQEFLNYLHFPADVSIIEIDQDKLDDDRIDQAILANQTPVDLGSVVPQYAMARAINGYGIPVILSGDGADELFGGYTRAKSFDTQLSDIFHELCYYHLPRLDRIMMSQTIELRCPFLAWKVIRSALTMPWQGYRTNKEILKNIARGIVPDEIIDRPKKPLRINQMEIDKQAWREYVIERFITMNKELAVFE